MKKSLMLSLIVPVAAVFAFASASLAADQPEKGKADQNRTQARAGASQSVQPDTDMANDPLASDRSGSRDQSAQRGRLPRHGQTASTAVEEDQWGKKKKKKDSNSGKSGNDEDADEDGGTPSGN
jgi:hypothetical protein